MKVAASNHGLEALGFITAEALIDTHQGSIVLVSRSGSVKRAGQRLQNGRHDETTNARIVIENE